MIPPLFPGPHARVADPATSHMAIPEKLTAQAFKVLMAYRTGLLLLDHEAYARVGMTGHQRCTDLRRAGFIVRVDRKQMPSGKDGYRCRITLAGVAWLKTMLSKDNPL
jgi:hypothetical protein